MNYGYQADKLSAARRCLMLPHPQGEDESIANAFHECTLAFHQLGTDGLDDNAKDWISKIKDLMDTSGFDDPSGRGTWSVKAQRLTTDQKLELSRAVDELAHWFDRKFWTPRAVNLDRT